jgi:hypothetical protein
MVESIGIIELPQYQMVMGDYRKAFLDPRLKFASLWFDTLLFEDLWNSENVILLEFMGQNIGDQGKPSFSEARKNLTISETKRFCQSTLRDEMAALIKLQRPNELREDVVQGILGNTTILG